MDAVYIGECDSFSDRFKGKHHALDKADWQQIAVASTTDETFNKAHARRAEHILVDAARTLRRTKVMTDQTAAGKLSDGDAAFVLDFVEDVALLSEIVEIRVFRGQRVIPKVAEGHDVVPSASVPLLEEDIKSAPIVTNIPSLATFRFVEAKDVEARMRADGAGFVILVGSQLREESKLACPPSVLALRMKAFQSGLVEPVPGRAGYLRLKVDFPAVSTSAAASLLTGTSLRGPHVWEHEATGDRYDRWIEKQQRTV